MKRYSHIFEKIANLDNIMEAINKAAKGKKDRKEVKRILDDPLFYANQIKELLGSK